MKIALPTRKDCKYIRRKLKLFYLANLNNEAYPKYESAEFRRALDRLFRFFQLPIPAIEWYDRLGSTFENNRILGQCTAEGTVKLLTPNKHGNGGFEGWVDTVYHEIGHYILWADCEKKAKEFASKMRNR
jgi:hypothetical protein